MADGATVPVGPPRNRALFGYLLLRANRLITPEQAIEALWGGAEPASARSQLHVTVSTLRGTLRPLGLDGVLVTRPGGYRLAVAGGELDAEVFDADVAAARTAAGRGDWAEASRLLRGALGLWRGEALAGVTAAYAHAEREQLRERWLSAQELWVDAELELGRHDQLVPELSRLVDERPLRERLVCQLMLAQYRAGRTADALETARRMRRRLAEEQGLDPGERFTALEKAVLRGDPGLRRRSTDRPRVPARQADLPVPAQLPLDVPEFTGREPQLAELAALAGGIGAPSVVLVVGTAGVGKTALALRWAHRHRDRFPDGQLYVDLRGFDVARPPVDPVDVLGRFLRGLGVQPGAIPDDVDEAAALLRSRLSGCRVLVVLDNARSAEQVRPLLPGTDGCAVLVTSRSQLRGLVAHEGARVLHLGPLAPEEAIRLLPGGPASVGDDGGPSAAGTVARYCAYLPLALRLAAARLAWPGAGTLEDYAAALATSDPLSILDGTGDPHGAVSATFGASYRALTPGAQRLFRLLSLTPGNDFAPVKAAAVVGATMAETKDPLEELRMAHLVVEHRPGRYTMHDLLRLYAARALESDESRADRSVAARRLVDFYADAVFEAYPLLQPRRLKLARDRVHPPASPLRFPDQAAALAWHDEEAENLVEVVRLAADHDWHHCAWQLTADLLAYFIVRRRWSTWLSALRIGRSSAERCGDPDAMAHMENAMGIVYKQTGRFAAARAHYRQAIDLAAAAGNDLSVAAFTANLGGLCVTEGDPEGAVRHLRDALAIPAYGQDPRYATVGHLNVGGSLMELGRYGQAAEALRRALELNDLAGDVQQACYCHHGLAEVALEQGDRVTARHHAESELRLAEQIGDPLRTACALDVLASVLVCDDPATARAHWVAAHKMYQDLNHPLGSTLADWLQALDRIEPAELAAADATHRRLRRRHI